MQRLIPQEVKNKVYEVTQQVIEENGNVEINEVQAVLERVHGICFFNMAELEKLIREGVEKQIFVYKNGTAQEVPVQEQYEGKCEHCGYDNKFKLSPGVHLPNEIFPEFCMKCKKEIKYSKLEKRTIDLSGISTKELSEELMRRDGIETTIAEPYKDVEVKVNGPAIVLVLID
ncbi:BC1881 family protein [Clostridium diolis]|uniref:BC1881 family protein n=1 Tax=Clostridium diolis TaxID=223919 RepID=UPI003AF4E32E